MKLFRITFLSLLIPILAFSEEKAKTVDAPTETQAAPQVEQQPAQATQAATKKSYEVTVNGAGITFIAVAVGGILIAALQSGGSIAH